MDSESDAAAKEMAATALLDQAAKNSRGVPMNPAPRSDAQPTDSGERETQLKRHLEDVERVRQGHLIRTAPMWLTVLCPDASSIVDYVLLVSIVVGALIMIGGYVRRGFPYA